MKKPLFFIAMILSFGQMIAQKNSIWHKAGSEQTSRLARVRPNLETEGELYFTLDVDALRQTLSATSDKFSRTPGVQVEIPNMNGEIEKFMVWENSNFEPALQAQYPDIRAYVGKGITDKGATINFSVSPQGIQTLVFRPDNGTEFIEAYDKAATTYVLFNSKNRNKGKLPFNCSTVEKNLTSDIFNKNTVTNLSSAGSYKTMRLALSCTAEYANYFGATSSAQSGLVLAAMNATMTRVNGVMEKDLALHLNIIANDASVFYYNASTDPYDNASTGAGGTWNAQLQSTLTSVLGDSAYDIGHLFGASGGGGNAGCIGCVCGTATQSWTDLGDGKGSGFTSPADAIPQGDNFDIDYVVHEMGHQLGGNHSFTFSYEGTNSTTPQTEPGSGSTIMGYAGITSYDVQAHSDALYSYKNIYQIQTNLASKTCPVSTTMTDNLPVVNAGADYTIPKGTAFILTGTATDADANDVLTYNWEQNDSGTSATVNATSRVLATKAVGPLFKTFPSASTPVRYMPEMARVIAGTISVTTSANTYWETVYGTTATTANRNLNFTFTARDNKAGGGLTATDAMVVTVDATKGPFTVTSQATTGISYAAGSTQTVTWNTASTSTLTGASTVDIYLSTNVNGNSTTFPTLLASGVSNAAGTASVVIPANTPASSTCRFMVKASGNIFFAVNSKNFAITALANDEFGFSNFGIYPNPNKGNFNVQFDSATNNDIVIAVHDIRGRNVYERQFTNTGLFSQNIQLDGVQSGVYMVTVKDGDKKVVKKIVVE